MITRRRIALFVSVVLSMLLIGFDAIAQEGQIVRETVYSPSLEGNLFGDPPKRDVTIYLPPSYDAEPGMLYPVVYLLHGYTCNNNLWFGGYGGNILNSMKSWLKSEKVKEMILVMPNSNNRLRGSWYTNSAATGNWADFIAEDLVKYIDSNYRTLPQRDSRAVIGHSMGGYGGMKLGMLYPEVFGCMGGMSGAYVTETFLQKGSGYDAHASTIENWSQFDSLQWRNQVSFAMAAAFAPNPDLPLFYGKFPFVYTDTKPRKIVKVQEVYDRFMEHDLHRMAEGRLDALLSMRAIYVDCGTSDDLIEEARELHEKLNSLGVEHVYKEFPGGHTCCLTTSTGNALEVFSEAMAFEVLVSVEPAGKLTTTWGQIREEE